MTATALSIHDPTVLSAAAPSDTAALTAAIAAGDADAFARFYRRWFDTMFRDARRVTGRDEAFCLDVVQDAMIRVIKRAKPLKHERDLRRWLGAVVRSCAYDRLRAESRRGRHERAAAQGRGHGVVANDADDADERVQRMRWLALELHELDARTAQLLVMRHRLGWTLARIGRAVGMKPGAVDGRLRRVVGRLRDRAEKGKDQGS